MTDTTCQVTGCDKPADTWTVCPTCGTGFEKTLAETPWLFDELEKVIAQQTRYTTERAGKSAEIPMPLNVKAVEVRDALYAALSKWAKQVADDNGWTVAVKPSAWLLANLTTIRLHVLGGQIVDEITTASDTATWLIDRPAARQFLGNCDQSHEDIPCPGSIYGRQGKAEAKCDTCGATWDAEPLRAYLLKKLDDKICTAAEIAHLTTYLGLHLNREQVRKRINKWHERNQITAHQTLDGDPAFRFGDAMDLLARDATRNLKSA